MVRRLHLRAGYCRLNGSGDDCGEIHGGLLHSCIGRLDLCEVDAPLPVTAAVLRPVAAVPALLAFSSGVLRCILFHLFAAFLLRIAFPCFLLRRALIHDL